MTCVSFLFFPTAPYPPNYYTAMSSEAKACAAALHLQFEEEMRQAELLEQEERRAEELRKQEEERKHQEEERRLQEEVWVLEEQDQRH